MNMPFTWVSRPTILSVDACHTRFYQGREPLSTLQEPLCMRFYALSTLTPALN